MTDPADPNILPVTAETAAPTAEGTGASPEPRTTSTPAQTAMPVPLKTILDGEEVQLPPTWTLLGEGYLIHRLLMFARVLDRENSRYFQQDYDMSVASWRVLAFLCIFGPASAADVSQAVDADRAEVSRAVARLLDSGMILRNVSPQHRKIMILTPTDAGRALHADIAAHRKAFFQELTQDMSEAERDSFESGLFILMRRLLRMRLA